MQFLDAIFGRKRPIPPSEPLTLEILGAASQLSQKSVAHFASEFNVAPSDEAERAIFLWHAWFGFCVADRTVRRELGRFGIIISEDLRAGLIKALVKAMAPTATEEERLSLFDGLLRDLHRFEEFFMKFEFPYGEDLRPAADPLLDAFGALVASALPGLEQTDETAVTGWSSALMYLMLQPKFASIVAPLRTDV